MRFSNDKPIFGQIADLLAEDIMAARLKAGDRLPSARELGASLEVNPNTAARALQALADSGVARCERGMGYYVAEGGAELARAERRKRFFDEDLPKVFKQMRDLGIQPQEILEQFGSA